MRTIVGFLPQQRHLSAKVSWNWSVSSFVDEVKRSWFSKVGGGTEAQRVSLTAVGEHNLVGKVLRTVLAGAGILFPFCPPCSLTKKARHRSLRSLVLMRDFCNWIPFNRALNPLKVPGWIFNGLYGNINRIKVTCNSVINEMSLVSMIKCSAIKLFIWKVILRKPDFWHLVIY